MENDNSNLSVDLKKVGKDASIDTRSIQHGHTSLHLAEIVHSEKFRNILHTIIDDKPEDIDAQIIDKISNIEDQSQDTQQKCIKYLKIFLNMKIDVNSKDSHHRTPLTIALEKRMRKVVEFLIDRGANVNHCDDQGNTLIHHLITVVHKKVNSVRIIHYAKLLELLISEGANVNCLNNDGHSPLDLATKYNLIRFIFILLSNINVHLISRGNTVLHVFIEFICQNKTYKKCIMQNNIKVYNMIEQLIEKGASVDAANIEGYSSLDIALRYFTDERLILLLLEYTAKINELNCDGDTFLHIVFENYIANEGKRSMSLSILKDLICRGADVNERNESGLTMLQVSIADNFVEIFRILKEHADFHVLTQEGDNLLNLACKTREVHQEIIDHLILQKFDLTFPDADALTPIHLAAQSGNLSMINVLLNCGIDVNCRENRQSRMPIHLAAEVNDDKTIEFLVRKGGNINARDANGATALSKVECQNVPLIETMFKLGVDLDARDNEDYNLLQRALENRGFIDMKPLYDLGLNVEHINYAKQPLKIIKMFFLDTLKGSQFYVQVIKLEFAELPVSRILQPFTGDNPRDLSIDSPLNILVERWKMTRGILKKICSEEIEKMKNHVINNTMDISIYDFLRMTPRQQMIHVNNDNLTKLVSLSSNIEELFPQYCGIIRAIYKEALKRGPLIVPARQAFEQLCGCHMPDLCVERIFNNLSNKDLESVVASLR